MAVTAETLDTVRRYRLAIGTISDAETRKMVGAWLTGWQSIADELAGAVAEVAHNAPESAAAVRRSRRLMKALDATGDQLKFITRVAAGVVNDDLPSAVELAGRTNTALLRSQLPTPAWGLVTDWDRVDQRAVASIIRRASERMNALSEPLSLSQAAALRSGVIAGLAAGDDPNRVARSVMRRAQDDFNGGLARAKRLARTEMLDAMRNASRLSDEENAELLDGWEWYSDLSPRTCFTCFSMHGRRFDAETPGPLGHPNCRCTRLPVTKSWAELGFSDIEEPEDLMPDAQEVFDSLDPRDQLALLGRARFDAYAAGDYPMGSWARLVDNDDWRASYRPTTPGYSGPTGAPPRPVRGAPGDGPGPELPDPDRPEWLRRHDELMRDLPTTEEEWRRVGQRMVVETPEDQRSKAINSVLQAEGGTPEELAARIAQMRARLPDLNELDRLISETPGITSMTRWPDHMKPLAQRLGISRRQPRTAWETVATERIMLPREIAQLEHRMDRARDAIARISAYPDSAYKTKVRWVEDIDEATGELGEATQRVLDGVLAVGRNIDDEIARRLATRMDNPEAAWMPNRSWFMKSDVLRATQREAVVREVLGELRDFGGGARPAYYASGSRHKRALVELMEESHSKYPSSWNDRVTARFGGVELKHVARGYNQGGKVIAISSEPGTQHWAAVGTHELGHSMELAVPGLRNLEFAFHHYRSDKLADGKLAGLKDLYGNKKEWYRPDKWGENYSGKEYRGRYAGTPGGPLSSDSQWEVFTTGIESLWDGSGYFHRGTYRKPNGFMDVSPPEYADDREFRSFILGVLGAL